METYGSGAFLGSGIDVVKSLNTRETVVVQSNIEDISIKNREEGSLSMGLKVQEIANSIISVIKRKKRF